MISEILSRLGEIRKRCDKATSGPWRNLLKSYKSSDLELLVKFTSEADANFIAHSRDDVPFLLNLCEKLLQENKNLKNNGRTVCQHGDPEPMFCNLCKGG